MEGLIIYSACWAVGIVGLFGLVDLVIWLISGKDNNIDNVKISPKNKALRDE